MLLITKRNKKVKKNLNKFKKTKFNYENFINEYYIDDDGKAYISTKVKSIDDIISKYSIKGYEWVNNEFIDYVENIANYIPIEESIVLEICGKKFTEEEQKLITKVLKQYFGLRLGDSVIDININKRKSLILLIFGIITFITFIILEVSQAALSLNEFMAFCFWFFLWEYLDYRMIDGYELYNKKIERGQLANIKIIFNENEK